MQLISLFKLKQFIQDPTHEQGGLLDVVIASKECTPHDAVVAEVGMSDHKLIH